MLIIIINMQPTHDGVVRFGSTCRIVCRKMVLAGERGYPMLRIVILVKSIFVALFLMTPFALVGGVAYHFQGLVVGVFVAFALQGLILFGCEVAIARFYKNAAREFKGLIRTYDWVIKEQGGQAPRLL